MVSFVVAGLLVLVWWPSVVWALLGVLVAISLFGLVNSVVD